MRWEEVFLSRVLPAQVQNGNDGDNGHQNDSGDDSSGDYAHLKILFCVLVGG